MNIEKIPQEWIDMAKVLLESSLWFDLNDHYSDKEITCFLAGILWNKFAILPEDAIELMDKVINGEIK